MVSYRQVYEWLFALLARTLLQQAGAVVVSDIQPLHAGRWLPDAPSWRPDWPRRGEGTDLRRGPSGGRGEMIGAGVGVGCGCGAREERWGEVPHSPPAWDIPCIRSRPHCPSPAKYNTEAISRAQANFLVFQSQNNVFAINTYLLFLG